MSKNSNKKHLYIITTFLLILTILFNLKYSIIMISGSSMEPTFYDGDIKLATKNEKLNRFDTVVIYTDDKLIIKRIIGLPGETIKYIDNKLYINNKLVKDKYNHGITNDFSMTLSDNSYCCLGDNRENSLDSRYYGEFYSEVILSKLVKGDK